jgi:hypothetical protein
MLTRLWAAHGIDPARVTVISRGGPASWYRRIGTGYVDAFDLFSVEEMRLWQQSRHDAESGQKHFAVTSFDDELLRRAAPRLPAEFGLVHPSLMYRRFLPFWAGRGAWRDVHRAVRFASLPKPSPPSIDELPDEYVAVKAYFSDCFPATDRNRAFLGDLIDRLATRSPVVLLSKGFEVDDHVDAAHGAVANGVVSISAAFTPRTNLDVQTAVIAGARALVTTYGGFSYLGPFLGVPTFSFFSERNFNASHLDVAHRAAAKLGGGGFVTFHVDDYAALSAPAVWADAGGVA